MYQVDERKRQVATRVLQLTLLLGIGTLVVAMAVATVVSMILLV